MKNDYLMNLREELLLDLKKEQETESLLDYFSKNHGKKQEKKWYENNKVSTFDRIVSTITMTIVVAIISFVIMC